MKIWLFKDGGGGNDILSGVDGLGNNDGSSGDDWFIQSAVLSNNELRQFKDGQQIGQTTSHVFNTNVSAANGSIVIGEEIAGLGFGELDVATVLVYDRALTDNERQLVEDFLHNKFIDDLGII